MSDLVELLEKKKVLELQRSSLEAEIHALEEAATNEGGVVLIGDQEVSRTFSFDGKLPKPQGSDFFMSYRKDEEGDPIEGGEITFDELIDEFGNDVKQKREEAIEAISKKLTEALASIGQDDSSGARGNAISAITSLKTAIEQVIANFNAKITADNASWTQQVTADLASLASTLEEALAAIGRSDAEGARKAALDAISALKSDVLAAIGQSDTEGARGDALEAIAGAKEDALASVGRTDTEGARKAALDAITQKATEANTAIDEKVTAAADSAALAKKYAENPEDSPVEEGTFSAKHYSEKARKSAEEAAAAANSPLSSETIAGRIKSTDNIDYTRGPDDTSPIAATLELAVKLRDDLSALIDSEAEIRAQSDTESNQRMDDIGESLAAEVTNREGADTNLQEAINTEVNDRTQGDANLQASIDLMKQRGGMMPGIIFPWVGPWDNRPARTLLCDGASYLQADYPDLFAAIGTKYNASTTPAGEFCVPDLTSKGYFIRSIKTPSATTAAVIDPLTGVKQEDAIRDIYGKLTSVAFDPNYTISADGAFSISDQIDYWRCQGSSKTIVSTRDVTFNASDDTSIEIADEVRPTSISFPFLIIY